MSKDNILEIIQKNYDIFTNVEKTIADYFLSNPSSDDFSSKHLKHKLFVSEASLSRFSKKCGFKGYREFVYRFEDDAKDITYVTGLNQTFHIYHELLVDIAKNMNEKQILRLGKQISQAKSIVIFSFGNSKLAALQMKSKFSRLGVIVDVVSEVDEIKIQSVLRSEENLVIGMSLSAKTIILNALKKAKSCGAHTALFTANQNIENHNEFIDELILVSSVEGLDTGYIISPQFPILVLIDICYYYYIQANKNTFSDLQKKTCNILEE